MPSLQDLQKAGISVNKSLPDLPKNTSTLMFGGKEVPWNTLNTSQQNQWLAQRDTGHNASNNFGRDPQFHANIGGVWKQTSAQELQQLGIDPNSISAGNLSGAIGGETAKQGGLQSLYESEQQRTAAMRTPAVTGTPNGSQAATTGAQPGTVAGQAAGPNQAAIIAHSPTPLTPLQNTPGATPPAVSTGIYKNLVNVNGTIYNTQTGKGYQNPTQLAGALGITADKIDWKQIASGSTPPTPPVSNANPDLSNLSTSTDSSPVPPTSNATSTSTTYFQGLTTQVDNAQKALNDERDAQQAKLEADKAAAQKELDDARAAEKGAIDQGGVAATAEKQAKLDELATEEKRFNDNYTTIQGLAAQLTDLMTQGNALIAQQKGVTGLASIRDPRVAKTASDLAAATGVIQAAISVYSGQMSQAQSQLINATNVINSAYTDELSYYTTLANFYGQKAGEANTKIANLTNDQQKFLDAKITDLQNNLNQVKKNAENLQAAMINPDTALAYAQAGVTLNDNPQQIAQKLATWGYSKELQTMSNNFAAKDYKAVVPGTKVPAGADVITQVDSNGVSHQFYSTAVDKPQIIGSADTGYYTVDKSGNVKPLVPGGSPSGDTSPGTTPNSPKVPAGQMPAIKKELDKELKANNAFDTGGKVSLEAYKWMQHNWFVNVGALANFFDYYPPSKYLSTYDQTQLNTQKTM